MRDGAILDSSHFGSETRRREARLQDRTNIGASSRVGRQRARGVGTRQVDPASAGCLIANVVVVRARAFTHAHTWVSVARTDARRTFLRGEGDTSPDIRARRGSRRSIAQQPPPPTLPPISLSLSPLPGLSYKSKVRFARPAAAHGYR